MIAASTLNRAGFTGTVAAFPSPRKAAHMEEHLADLVGAVHDAESRLLAMTPRTEAWRDAQRDTVRARADYWQASSRLWDLNHIKRPGAPPQRLPRL